MTSSYPAAQLEVQLQPGRPPMLWAAAGGNAQGWAASTGTRCAPWSTSTARFWSVASGCVTWPRSVRCSGASAAT